MLRGHGGREMHDKYFIKRPRENLFMTRRARTSERASERKRGGGGGERSEAPASRAINSQLSRANRQPEIMKCPSRNGLQGDPCLSASESSSVVYWHEGKARGKAIANRWTMTTTTTRSHRVAPLQRDVSARVRENRQIFRREKSSRGGIRGPNNCAFIPRRKAQRPIAPDYSFSRVDLG